MRNAAVKICALNSENARKKMALTDEVKRNTVSVVRSGFVTVLNSAPKALRLCNKALIGLEILRAEKE
ncbi:hypothetical protein Baya_6328 [Bagarius yarrelli]|uniref:Uncharacterized protein n=1 Tax=Bagarius yarrelli TaxID=175774 RepID=A0A556TXZ8_BAGYA|nr:hypothetical protein Baya_6328 [Bagarius yarrelli]